MTVNDIVSQLDLEVLNMACSDREIEGGYTGDLLSWVMSKAKYGDAWITIMTNVNIVAVASLVDTACVIVAENAELADDVIEKAKQQGVNLFRSEKSSFTLCLEIAKMLKI